MLLWRTKSITLLKNLGTVLIQLRKLIWWLLQKMPSPTQHLKSKYPNRYPMLLKRLCSCSSAVSRNSGNSLMIRWMGLWVTQILETHIRNNSTTLTKWAYLMRKCTSSLSSNLMAANATSERRSKKCTKTWGSHTSFLIKPQPKCCYLLKNSSPSSLWCVKSLNALMNLSLKSAFQLKTRFQKTSCRKTSSHN